MPQTVLPLPVINVTDGARPFIASNAFSTDGSIVLAALNKSFLQEQRFLA